jgi:hypothetical protein
MTTTAMHAPPSLRDVTLEQIKSVGLRVRAVGVLLIGAMLLYGVVVAGVVRKEQHSALANLPHPRWSTFGYTPEISILLTYLALLLPVLMWHEENLVKRTYHLAMPVARSTHALVKTLAGWVWAMVGTGFFVAIVVIVDMVTRSMLGLPPGLSERVEWWGWFVPFTSVTIAYVLGSAAAVGALTPAVWVVGPPVLCAAAGIALGSLGYPGASQSVLKIFSGEFGAAAAIGGRVVQPDDWGRVLGMPSGWFGATVIWGAAATILLVVVSRRRSPLT